VPSQPPRPERIITWIQRRRWPVLAVALVLSGLAILASSELRILTSRKSLLPEKEEVSRRLDAFLTKFGAASDLIVVVDGGPRPDQEDFASALAARLNRSDQVASAIERVDLLFFLKRAYLMIPPDGLEKFRAVLAALIGGAPPEPLTDWDTALAWLAKWLKNPGDLDKLEVDIRTAEEGLHLLLYFMEQWQRWLDSPQPPRGIAWNLLAARHGAESMADSYFASKNGEMHFIFVHPVHASGEFEVLDPFIRAVRGAADALSQEWVKAGRKPPRVGLTSLPAIEHEEYLAIKSDILLVLSTAVLLVILLIVTWLRSARWALLVFVPMGLGVLWNTGMTYLLVGHMTILTSGFTAILFGLGVDYGIFMSTRVIEELGRGTPLEEAISRGVAASAKGILGAGGATIGIFLALTPSIFPGFAELGLVSACGVGLVLASTFFVQPALFRLIPPKIKPKSPPAPAPESDPEAVRVKAGRWRAVLWIAIAAGAAVAGGVATMAIPFNYDVLSLLPRNSEAAEYQRRMVEESDFQGEVVIFTARDLPEARRIAREARTKKSIARIESLVDLFPEDVEARATGGQRIGALVDASEYVKQIRALGPYHFSQERFDAMLDSLESVREVMEDGQEQAFSAGHQGVVKVLEQLLARLEVIERRLRDDRAHGRERTEAFLEKIYEAADKGLAVLASWTQAKPLSPADLPSMLQSRFFASDQTMALYAFPARTVYDPEALDALMADVYSVSAGATGFPTTHQVFSRLVVKSFEQGTLLSGLVAILWIGLILRRLRGTLVACLPLLVGGGWMMGALWLIDMPFNYANIIALPLVMGLAVDYGVWFAHRAHELDGLPAWTVARQASRAILLAAGTTLAGLGAITLASYRGVATMGVSITIGLLCCVAAALLVAPAVTHLFPRRLR
jgi:predicted RND superfamily exporter protein